MNLDSLSFALSQISYSVANLTKKNYKSSVAEISHLISQHGAEADRHLFRCLFSHVDFSGDGHSSGKDFHQIHYLTQECSSLIRKSNFVSILCYAIDNPLHHQKSLRSGPNLFNQLIKTLRLAKVQEVAFGLALLNSTKIETQHAASDFLKLKLNSVLVAYIAKEPPSTEEEIHESPVELLHLLLGSVLSDKDFNIQDETKESFQRKLREHFTAERVGAIVRPLLYPNTEDLHPEQLNPDALATPTGIMATSLADTVREIGYGFTSSLEECRNTLMQLGVREITPPSIARVLGMMAKTTNGLTDSISVQALGAANNQFLDNKEGSGENVPLSWNVDIFVQALKDLAPHLNWKDVVGELDHHGFLISDKQGLRLLVQALSKAISDVFPIEAIYRAWKNTEGQLSWMTMAIKHPDVFCFADYRFHGVNLEQLKSPPDEENRDIAIWKSLDLVETLIRLSDSGHYQPVWELFKFPVQHCPDLLVFALLQISQWNRVKQELLQILIPVFLGNHPNSGQVLSYAWQVSGQSAAVRTIIMHSMAEWYMRGDMHDQTRLSRILDVAQDLKALSQLLKATPFAFVIDLACLASRREYLKLEKWLGDQIHCHKEPFLKEIALYLRRRCPQLVPSAHTKEEAAKITPLPLETMQDLLTKLQQYAQFVVSPELQELISTILQNAQNTLKARPGQSVPLPVQPKAPLPTPGAMPGLPAATPPTPNPMDPMNMLGSIGANVGGSTIASQAAGLPASLASSLPASAAMAVAAAAVGSPAKNFQPPLNNPAASLGQPGFNHSMQNITSQLQNLSMQTTMTSSLGNTPTKAPNPSQNSLPGFGGGGGLGGLGPGATGGLGVLGPGAVGSLGGLGPAPGSQFNPQVQQQQQQRVNQQQPGRPVDAFGNMTTPGSAPPTPVAAPNPVNTAAVSSANAAAASADLAVTPLSQHFPREIEDEANSYFQRIYTHSDTSATPALSIDEVLDMLKRFKDSQHQQEKNVFACMLRNLFEEYRFFPQYPDKELHTTAVLFGGIIEQGLVTYIELGIALRYVLEALKKPPGQKMYYFGIAALDRFKTRLKDYPQYCQYLGQIPHFSQFPQILKDYCEYGAQSAEPPARSSALTVTSAAPSLGQLTANTSSSSPTVKTTTTTSTTTTTTTSTAASHTAIVRPKNTSVAKPSIATATNIDTLIAGQQDLLVPPESVQDKIFFIFNNISLINIDTKAKELKDLVEEKYMPWCAQYMVMKRASIEANFHPLYAKLLECLQIEELKELVIAETFRNIRVLLRSDKGVSNFSDRSLLKNLGHWLGRLTLAKNKPILHDDIDLKTLLYEAYHKGPQEMLYVVPFVAKVMESCAHSKVFKTPNPWTLGIMNVLAELHQEHDLKLNLKFEIEVLCKNLTIDINDLQPGQYLQDIERLNVIDNQLSAPRKQADSSTPQPEEPLQINMPTPAAPVVNATPVSQAPVVEPPTPSTRGPVLTGVNSMGIPQSQFSYHEINTMSLAGLGAHIVINLQLDILAANPQLKSLVVPALERSVQEVLPPLVERSIKIALTACEQIVKKDFALDPEEGRMRAAAHHMVRFMTSGMALITCREPLLLSITKNILQAFNNAYRGALPRQKDMIEQAASVLAQDNIDLACAFIQKTAVEKAMPEMDKRLATDFELRKLARSEGRRYCDPVVLTYQAERMPEQIRLKVGHVTHQQIAVYEEFARNIPGFAPSSGAKQEKAATLSVAASVAGYMSRAGGAGQQSVDNSLTEEMNKLFRLPDDTKFQPGLPGPSLPTSVPEGPALGDDITRMYDRVAREIDATLRHLLSASPNNSQKDALTGLLDAIMASRNTRDLNAAVHLVHKAVEGLQEGLTALPGNIHFIVRFRDCHLLLLKGLNDPSAYGPQWTSKQVTKALIDCRDEYKYNIEAVDCLIRAHLVSMQQYDSHLAQCMENGSNYMAVTFAMQLVQRFSTDSADKSGTPSSDSFSQADFCNTIEMLTAVSRLSRQCPEGLQQLVDTLRTQTGGALLDRAAGGPASMMHSGISQAREFDDPPGLHEKTEFLLKEWVTMYHSPAAGRDSGKAFPAFVAQMHQHGILKTDELITRFFRLCTEMCVELVTRALAAEATPSYVRSRCFYTLDAFVRLITLLVKHSGESANTITKINLLNKVLGIVAGVLLQDHEVRKGEFQQMPYHRIFIMLFIELNNPDVVLESINYQVLTAFCNTLHILRPAKAAGFSYAWLELISHRVFVGRMLAITPQQKGWGMYAQLLIDLLNFLSPFLRNAELDKPTQLLYKGTLRVLLVLLHDFPEFLCDFHYAFCDVIPPNCIQMRNLILSAFPRNMRLPDPFTPNLKVDMLHEIALPPRIMTAFHSNIEPAHFKKDLDSYLQLRSPVTFLSELRSNLQVSSEPGMRYNIPLMNALVLYVGTQAIAQIHAKNQTPSMSTIAHSSHMDIFQNLAIDLDTEGRYLFLNAISNQLRYPNSHTHYFSCTLLYLFAEANNEAIQEQITRVLLERLIVNRPHPWGLLITFIELIKNPQFKFWKHDFVHCAPEIQKLFESVAKSCMPPRQQTQQNPGMRPEEGSLA